MSNAIFPALPGLKWETIKTPIWSTRIQRAVSGREYRAPYFLYPLWEFQLSYEILRDDTVHNELKSLMGFYVARQGGFDDFLYLDPSFNTVTAQAIAAGDGNTKTFQMQVTFGGFTEPIYDIDTAATFNVYLAGVVQNPSTYTMPALDAGILTFASAPGNNVAITADFTFYRRVRFNEYKENTADSWQNFMYRLWELKQIIFVTAR